MSSEWLRKAVGSLKKPISPVSLGRDVLATAIKGTQALDKATGLTDKLSKIAFDKLGPASPKVIKAADAVERSRIAGTVVKAAKAGGPLTKAFKQGYKLGTAADKKWGISDKLAKALPLPGARGKSAPVKVKAAVPSVRGGTGNPRATSTSNLNIPHLKLKLPRLGQSLPKVRAQQSRVGALQSPASRAAWSAAHMKMRTLKPSAGSAFSAKHMKMRTAPSATKRMVLGRPSFKVNTTKSMSLSRSTKVARPASFSRNPAPMRRSAPPMRPAGPPRGFRR